VTFPLQNILQRLPLLPCLSALGTCCKVMMSCRVTRAVVVVVLLLVVVLVVMM
jgi:hypothetical protein